jgi:hypothetical protein
MLKTDLLQVSIAVEEIILINLRGKTKATAKLIGLISVTFQHNSFIPIITVARTICRLPMKEFMDF